MLCVLQGRKKKRMEGLRNRRDVVVKAHRERREEGGGETCSAPDAPLRNLLAAGLGARSARHKLRQLLFNVLNTKKV